MLFISCINSVAEIILPCFACVRSLYIHPLMQRGSKTRILRIWDGIKINRVGYELLHKMELLCLRVDDVIPILSPAVVLVGVVLKDSLGGTTMWQSGL